MKTLIFMLIASLITFTVPAQDFVTEDGSVTITITEDVDTIKITREEETKAYLIAWTRSFPVTHLDIACDDDKIYVIRMKSSILGRKFKRVVIIHTDYTKEKYKLG